MIAMDTTTRLARSMLLGSGVLALLFGLNHWAGNGARVFLLHELMGLVLVLSLWTLAFRAARSGLPTRTVALTATLGLVVLAIGVVQKELLPGSWHWTIRLLHVGTGLGAVVWGQWLVSEVRASEIAAARGLGPRSTIKEAAAQFLAKKRIAVTGVSRKEQPHGSNIVYQRLRQRGYEVFAVNPHAERIEGDRCFHDLKSIPGGVDAVLIGTRPENAMATMRECADLGIRHVWMHRSVGTGSVSREAAAWGRARGIHVIDGGCPLMFDPTADAGHKVMRPMFTLAGKVPRRVS